MRIRMPLLGSGTPGDLHRADAASYALVGIDYVARLITVEIPDEDAPPNMPAAGSPQFPQTDVGPILIGLPAPTQAAWIAKLRARYPQHVFGDGTRPA